MRPQPTPVRDFATFASCVTSSFYARASLFMAMTIFGRRWNYFQMKNMFYSGILDSTVFKEKGLLCKDWQCSDQSIPAMMRQWLISGGTSARIICFSILLGKPLSTCLHLYLGIAQIAITPPPALKRALWGTFFQARFSHFKGLYASGVPVLLAVSSSLVCE